MEQYPAKNQMQLPDIGRIGVKCDRNNPADKYHFEAFDSAYINNDSTFELVGPKVQGNPEGFKDHTLLQHSSCVLPTIGDYSFDGLKRWLTDNKC